MQGGEAADTVGVPDPQHVRRLAQYGYIGHVHSLDDSDNAAVHTQWHSRHVPHLDIYHSDAMSRLHSPTHPQTSTHTRSYTRTDTATCIHPQPHIHTHVPCNAASCGVNRPSVFVSEITMARFEKHAFPTTICPKVKHRSPSRGPKPAAGLPSTVDAAAAVAAVAASRCDAGVDPSSEVGDHSTSRSASTQNTRTASARTSVCTAWARRLHSARVAMTSPDGGTTVGITWTSQAAKVRTWKRPSSSTAVAAPA